MTLSQQERTENLRLLMGRLLEIVGDDNVYKHAFDQGDPQFSDVLPTSWGQLRTNHYIVGVGPRKHRLTVIGWSRCLEETGKLEEGTATEDKQTTERCGRLAAVAKGYVKAIGYEEDATVEFQQFASASQLPPGWLFNAIGGSLLLLRFKYPLRRWEIRWIVEGSLLLIPAVFGHPV